MRVVDARGSSPIGSALDDDLSQALASEDYRNVHAELSVAEAVARVVIQLRMKLKLTQQQLAQRMDTSPSTIARLESGQYVPSLATPRPRSGGRRHAPCARVRVARWKWRGSGADRRLGLRARKGPAVDAAGGQTLTP